MDIFQLAQIHCQIAQDLVGSVEGKIGEQRRHIAGSVLEDEIADSGQCVGDGGVGISPGI